MIYIILALYAILIITFVFIVIFVAYHLAKYSLSKYLKNIMVPFFVLVSVLLIFSNIMFFLSIDWKKLIPNFLNF
jgi:hypothetical protein